MGRVELNLANATLNRTFRNGNCTNLSAGEDILSFFRGGNVTVHVTGSYNSCPKLFFISVLLRLATILGFLPQNDWRNDPRNRMIAVGLFLIFLGHHSTPTLDPHHQTLSLPIASMIRLTTGCDLHHVAKITDFSRDSRKTALLQ
jgi:hypothetical protein